MKHYFITFLFSLLLFPAFAQDLEMNSINKKEKETADKIAAEKAVEKANAEADEKAKLVAAKAATDKILADNAAAEKAAAEKAAAKKLARENNMSFGGGPQYAVLSVLLPGMGDRIVNKNSKVWPVVTGLYVGSVATAVFFKINSNKNYQLYKNVGWDADGNYKNDLNTFYDKANNNNTNFNIMLGLAGSILLADVIYVAVKGAKNKNKYNKASTFVFPVINFNSSFNRSFQLSFIQKI